MWHQAENVWSQVFLVERLKAGRYSADFSFRPQSESLLSIDFWHRQPKAMPYSSAALPMLNSATFFFAVTAHHFRAGHAS